MEKIKISSKLHCINNGIFTIVDEKGFPFSVPVSQETIGVYKPLLWKTITATFSMSNSQQALKLEELTETAPLEDYYA